jgi:hypothetical protein
MYFLIKSGATKILDCIALAIVIGPEDKFGISAFGFINKVDYPHCHELLISGRLMRITNKNTLANALKIIRDSQLEIKEEMNTKFEIQAIEMNAKYARLEIFIVVGMLFLIILIISNSYFPHYMQEL